MILTEYKRERNMKPIKYLFMSLLILTALFIAGCSKSEKNADVKHAHEQGVKKEFYTCTMHPQVISDKPGVCPICNMELIKKTADDSPTANTLSGKDMEEMIAMNNNKQVLANVTTAKVEKSQLQKEVTAYSYIDFAEQNRKIIAAKFNGRIEKLFVNKSGEYVNKGQALFELYSPDIVQAENEYIILLTNNLSQMDIISKQTDGNKKQESLIQSARKKLELYGLTEKQIKEIESSKQVKYTITYFSPISGTVIDKKVQEGMYINEGAVLYDIADLSTVWSITEVNEKDINSVKVGSKSVLRLQAYPAKTFEGKVIFISPVMNSGTRSIKVRSEFANHNNLLKPQMYGESTFKSNFGSGLLVPAGAVLFTGKRNIVWVKLKDGMFEARTVQTGNKFDDKYEVISGLKEGEEVAATGAYLIDSESQLKTGMPTGHQHGDSEKMQNPAFAKDHSSNDAKGMEKMNESSGIQKTTNNKTLHKKIWNQVCPVLGNEVDPDVKPVEYNGKLYGFCCPGCDAKFKNDPARYAKNLSDDGKKFIKQ